MCWMENGRRKVCSMGHCSGKGEGLGQLSLGVSMQGGWLPPNGVLVLLKDFMSLCSWG